MSRRVGLAIAWGVLLALLVIVFRLRDGQVRGDLEAHRRADSVATAGYVRQRDSALAEVRAASLARDVAQRAWTRSDSLRRRIVLRNAESPAAGRIRETAGISEGAADTVVVPASVVALVEALDSTVASQREALRADSAAIAALRASLVAADTALAAKSRRVDALEGAGRNARRAPACFVGVGVNQAGAPGAFVGCGYALRLGR